MGFSPRWRACLLVLVALTAAPGCSRTRAATDEAPVRVFLLAGQSNMVGRGDVADLDPALLKLPANVQIDVEAFGSNLEKDSTRFGPEMSLVPRLAQRFRADELLVIKRAVGGSSLLDWAPDWSESRAAITGFPQFGPLYDKLLARIRELTRGRNVHFEALFWMQGERDARIPKAGRDYYENWKVFIARLRRDLQAPHLPVIAGQVNPPREDYPAVQMVRRAQERVAGEDPDVVLVSTEGLSKLADRLHYDSNGQLQLGNRFADAYLALAQP